MAFLKVLFKSHRCRQERRSQAQAALFPSMTHDMFPLSTTSRRVAVASPSVSPQQAIDMQFVSLKYLHKTAICEKSAHIEQVYARGLILSHRHGGRHNLTRQGPNAHMENAESLFK